MLTGGHWVDNPQGVAYNSGLLRYLGIAYRWGRGFICKKFTQACTQFFQDSDQGFDLVMALKQPVAGEIWRLPVVDWLQDRTWFSEETQDWSLLLEFRGRIFSPLVFYACKNCVKNAKDVEVVSVICARFSCIVRVPSISLPVRCPTTGF